VTPKQFALFLARDQRCYHCGSDTDLIPQHRINRGMGGSKARNKPSNIISFCALFNGLIESDPRAADMARRWGWKLNSWDSTTETAVFDASSGKWFVLDDSYGRTDVTSFWE
jgi:hypothetical protein